MRFIKTVMCITILVLTSLFIIYSNVVKASVLNALNICVKSVIPSLLPISCLIGIISSCGFLSAVPKRLGGLFLFLISIISGYPIGVKTLNTLVLNGQINNKAAEKIVPSLICGGPAFIISVVGLNVFQNINIGIRIYLSVIISNLVIFAIKGGFKIKINQYPSNVKIAHSITNAIKDATNSVTYICSFVILFSSIGELIKIFLGSNAAKYVLYTLEVTSAVLNSNNVFITCYIVSFGGLCVIVQALSVAENFKINLLQLIIYRLISALISCVFLKFSFIILPLSDETISTVINPPKLTLVNNETFLICFIVSLLVFLISISTKSLAQTSNSYGKFN